MNIAAIFPPLTERPAWKALETHYQQIRGVQLRQLFGDDPQRGEHLSAEALGHYSERAMTFRFVSGHAGRTMFGPMTS